MFRQAVGEMVWTPPVPEIPCVAWPLTSHTFFGAEKC